MGHSLTRQKTQMLCMAAAVAALLAGCHGKDDNPTGNQSGTGTCASPITLGTAVELKGQSTERATDGVSGDDSTCVGFATHGAERVYRVTVPAASQTKLHLEVEPEQSPSADAFDPVVYVSENCSANPTCVAGQDMRGGGGTESLDFVNSSAEDKSLYVVVDGYGFQGGGAFTLAATLSAP
jgi:hypothetical protein